MNLEALVTNLLALIGYLVTVVVLFGLIGLSLTEYVGARIPGFSTISDAARLGVSQGDFRIFVLIEIALLIAAIWWPLHVLWPRL